MKFSKPLRNFDPLANDNTAISDCPGNYVIALREDAVFARRYAAGLYSLLHIGGCRLSGNLHWH